MPDSSMGEGLPACRQTLAGAGDWAVLAYQAGAPTPLPALGGLLRRGPSPLALPPQASDGVGSGEGRSWLRREAQARVQSGA